MATSATSAPSVNAADEKDYSAAERLLFMSEQLRNVKPPATLRYTFRKGGALEENFQDSVTLALASHLSALAPYRER